MEFAIAMIFFFIIITMVFVAVAIFLPEWIGITGSKAKEVIADQQGEQGEPPLSQDTIKPPQE